MEEKKIDWGKKLYDGGSTFLFIALLHVMACPAIGLIYVIGLASALTLVGYAKMDKNGEEEE